MKSTAPRIVECRDKVENVEIGLGQPFCFGQVRGSVVPLKKGCVPLPLMLVAVAVVGIGAGVWLKHIKQPDKPIDPDPDTNAPPVIITPPKVNETLCDMWNRIKKEEDALKRINSLTAFQDNHTGEIRTATASLIDIYVGPDCGQKQIFASKGVSAKEVVSDLKAAALNIKAYPNPSAAEFILNLEGYGTAKVAIVVTDIMGRKVFQAEGNARPQYRFGNSFTAGIYNVQVISGTDKKQIKVVKE